MIVFLGKRTSSEEYFKVADDYKFDASCRSSIRQQP